MNNDESIKVTIELGDKAQTVYINRNARQLALPNGIDIAVLEFEYALKNIERLEQSQLHSSNETE